jgi:hypothetical protein
MSCPVCGANAEQITGTIDGVSIVCPMCGEYDVASSVIARTRAAKDKSAERVSHGVGADRILDDPQQGYQNPYIGCHPR